MGDAVEGLPKIKVYNIRLSLGLERFMHAVEKGEELLSSGFVTGILVRGILVRGTKIFSGKLVRPDRFFREKWSASGKLVRIMVRP